jgi:hypothetical protein
MSSKRIDRGTIVKCLIDVCEKFKNYIFEFYKIFEVPQKTLNLEKKI